MSTIPPKKVSGLALAALILAICAAAALAAAVVFLVCAFRASAGVRDYYYYSFMHSKAPLWFRLATYTGLLALAASIIALVFAGKSRDYLGRGAAFRRTARIIGVVGIIGGVTIAVMSQIFLFPYTDFS